MQAEASVSARMKAVAVERRLELRDFGIAMETAADGLPVTAMLERGGMVDESTSWTRSASVDPIQRPHSPARRDRESGLHTQL